MSGINDKNNVNYYTNHSLYYLIQEKVNKNDSAKNTQNYEQQDTFTRKNKIQNNENNFIKNTLALAASLILLIIGIKILNKNNKKDTANYFTNMKDYWQR